MRRWFGAQFQAILARDRRFQIARWVWLRALGAAMFTAFASVAPDIGTLIGPHGIAPAADYLSGVHARRGVLGFLSSPTLLWVRSDDVALGLLVTTGLVASLALTLNVFPRLAAAVCAIALLSFVRAAPEFSGAEPDGLLVEGAVTAIVIAPRGYRPGMGNDDPPTRLAWGVQQLLWYRLILGSGIAKLVGPGGQWLSLSALDDYYELQPFPTRAAWWMHQLPHGAQVSFVVLVLACEILAPIVALVSVTGRIVAFSSVACLQVAIAINGNYASLNYLSLALGVCLLDDRVLSRLRRSFLRVDETTARPRAAWPDAALALAVCLGCVTSFAEGRRRWYELPGRLANNFGVGTQFALFDAMPREHPVLEFQTSEDGHVFIPLHTKYSPGGVTDPPRLYAPYQPRFDWGLWYAALAPDVHAIGLPREVGLALLRNAPHLDRLFDRGVFAGSRYVRIVKYRYRFTTVAERRTTGAWWVRQPVDVVDIAR